MIFDQFFQWPCDKIDHGNEGATITVREGSCSGGLEDAIEAPQPCIGIGRSPSPKDEEDVPFKGGQGH